MIKKQHKNKSNQCIKLCAAFLFPFALFGGVALINANHLPTFAAEEIEKYHNESVSITNSSFYDGSKPSTSGNSLSGWNAIETDSKAKGMLIDVGTGTSSDPSSSNTTFDKNSNDYLLSENPGAHSNLDSRILMINSKEKIGQKNVKNFKGYKSSSITLEANSYYVFSVSAKAMLNGDDFANGSIYIHGIKDKSGETLRLGYENFTNTVWKEFYFFIATGNESQTVTVQLYLGTASGTPSEGVVFFDNVNATRYSQNQFMELCVNDYHYQNKDVKLINYDEEKPKETIFLIDELISEKALNPEIYLHKNSENMNLDFEDEILPGSDTLGEHWKIITGGNKSNASARIMDVAGTQQKDFKDLTGFNNPGNDFGYENNQSLVLWTTNQNYSQNGYIGIRSEDISISANEIYKVSLSMKFAGYNSGSFYIQIKENNYIYEAYPTLLSKNSEDYNYYELGSGKSTNISSNATDVWKNNYQTIEMYVKGHNLYNSSVNLELWLGDSSSPASACVVIDNIKIEKATDSNFSNAGNKLELKKSTSPSLTFTNADFNTIKNESETGSYPLVADGWTKDVANENLSESGVIYLADKKEYDELYTGKYSWAGINPNKTSLPNNVYMMFNKADTYQSISSQSSPISQNSYYKLSFEYYNQDYIEDNSSKIKVEIIDDNGIVLFSVDNISSKDEWSTMNIYIHTAETVSHSVSVKISLGDEQNPTKGIVYLDNFDIKTAENFEEEFENALYKVDLSNYYFNLNSDSTSISDSPAFTYSVDSVYDQNYSTNDDISAGGIVNGKNNDYNITSENNILVLQNKVASSTSLKSKFKLSLDATSYYVLSFDLQTRFNKDILNTTTDHDCSYGLKVTIDGYEAITELKTEDEMKTFTIYYHNENSSTPNITFSLVSDCDETIGIAFITNFDFKKTTENNWANAQLQPDFNSTIFKAKASNSSDEDVDNNENDSNTSDNNTSTSNSGIDSRWLLVSSIIMGVALIIAIVGYFMRKIKIKKIDKIKKETYDRKLNINHDEILAQAQKRRDEEVAELQKAIQVLSDQKTALEEEHKKYVKEQRQLTKGKLTRQDEIAFKKYNSDLNRVDEKINILKEKIDYCMTPDYLLTIERKIVSEEDEKFNAEKKAKKAAEKEKNNAEQ